MTREEFLQYKRLGNKKYYIKHRAQMLSRRKENYKKNKERDNLTGARTRNRNYYGGNRELALLRDDYECVLCKSCGLLDVHHIDGSGGTKEANNELCNLLTLCHSCHKKQHIRHNYRHTQVTKEKIGQKSREYWQKLKTI